MGELIVGFYTIFVMRNDVEVYAYAVPIRGHYREGFHTLVQWSRKM